MLARPIRVAALLLLALPAPARPDELHLSDGRVVHGRLAAETRSAFKFLEAGKTSPDSFKRAQVARVVLTWGLPDSVASDPLWSPEAAQLRIDEAFDETSRKDVEVLRSEHYVLFTNSSAGEAYLETMEDVHARFQELFPFESLPGTRLLPVFLFRTNDQYWDYTARMTGRSQEAASRSGGHSWKDYYATYYEAPRDPIHYHEGAHQLVGNRLGIPGGGSWFQEGMAVYFEGTLFPGEDPAKGMRSELRGGRATPWAEMLGLRSLLYSTGDDADPARAGRHYQQAGAMIKFLIEGPDAALFPRLLAAVRAGQDWDTIFREVYGRDSAEMDAAFAEFFDA